MITKYPALPDELCTRLVASNRRMPLFSHPEWFANLQRHAPHNCERAEYLVRGNIREPGPLSCLPLVVIKGRLGREVQALSNYYTCLFDAIVPTGEAEEAAREFAAFIASDIGNDTDIINLRPMDAESPFFKAFSEALRGHGYLTDSYYCFGNWYLEVAGRSYAEYLAGLGSKIRKNVPRFERRLEKEGGTFHLITGFDNLEWGINSYETVYRKSWKQAEPHPDFIPSLCRMAARHGWLRLGIITLNETPIAAQLWLVKDEEAHIYKLAYDEDFSAFRAGSVLTSLLMRHVIDEDGVDIVDYGMGDDPYKQDWMSHRRERRGLIAFNKRRPLGVLAALHHFGGKLLKPLRLRMKRLLHREDGRLTASDSTEGADVSTS